MSHRLWNAGIINAPTRRVGRGHITDFQLTSRCDVGNPIASLGAPALHNASVSLATTTQVRSLPCPLPHRVEHRSAATTNGKGASPAPSTYVKQIAIRRQAPGGVADDAEPTCAPGDPRPADAHLTENRSSRAIQGRA